MMPSVVTAYNRGYFGIFLTIYAIGFFKLFLS